MERQSDGDFEVIALQPSAGTRPVGRFSTLFFCNHCFIQLAIPSGLAKPIFRFKA